jgi:hypothetical protein
MTRPLNAQVNMISSKPSLEKARLRRTAWFRRWLAAALDADIKPSST